ncbi:MAG: PAS domain S-box protein, partial [Nitrospirota bacterium]
AYSDKKIIEKAMMSGPYGYIVKPFSDRELSTTIESALSKHQLEKKLIESEEKFRDLFDSAGDVILIVDDRGNVIDINRRAASLTGYTHDELLRCNILRDLVMPEDRNVLKSIMEQPGYDTSRVYEIKWKAKDGSVIVFEGSSSPRFTEEGRLEAMRCILRDVSERKRAENMLKLLKEAVESLPIGITISDVDGRIVYLNPAEAQIHGYSVDEVVGKDSRIFAPEELWKPVTFEDIHLKGIWKRESINIRKNGETFPVQLISIAVKNAQGVPIGIVIACEDITERKKAEEELIKRQEALHSVYKMATTIGGSFKAICDEVVLNIANLLKTSRALVLKRADGRFRAVSAALDGSLIRGQHFPTDFLLSFVESKGEVFTLSGPLPEPAREALFIDGDVRSLIYVPVLDTSDSVIGSIIALDSAEREFSDGEIQLLEIFARYVAHEIEWNAMETQLRQMEKMKVYGQLTAGVAHEVRNPLNAILAITEALVLDLGEQSAYQSYLVHIRTQVDRLSRLMEDLLDLGKPLLQSRLRKEPLIEMCSSVIDLWNQSTASLSHPARMDVHSAGRPFVIADIQKMQQVFLNLLENASQHSNEGTEIGIIVMEPESHTIRVRVTDRGAGISPENLSKVFEPFFTVRKKGTGLGLSIVKHIVEAHGGRVRIWNNDPEAGCTVEVNLPVVPEGGL